MTFKHYLNFITLHEIGRIEIGEPINFDKSSYKVKQSESRFGRDIVIANEDTELIFTREYFEQLGFVQQLPSGELIDYASQGFDFLLDIFDNEGTQGEVEYIISKDGVDFTTGIFSYFTMIVQFDQIKVKIIQNTARETIKRLEDTDVDAFSDKALDNRTITPCTTTNILLKAKPIYSVSSWKNNSDNAMALGQVSKFLDHSENTTYRASNNANVTVDYGIKNSLSFISNEYACDNVGNLNDENFSYLYAQDNLNNVQIDLSNLVAYSKTQRFNSSDILTASGYVKLVVRVGLNVDDTLNEYILYSKSFTNADVAEEYLATDYSLNIPFIQRGYRLYIYAYGYAEATFNASPSFITSYACILDIQTLNVKITAVSTAINTVVKGVRLCDLIEHNIQSLADVTLDAPDYQLGGEHYNNFAFNGLLLGQITDKPFYNKFKDLSNIFDETCSDIQINTNNVEAHHYSEYYKDIELASFQEVTDYESETNINKRYSLKTAEFNYKSSAQNRETSGENTIDDVHTQTQKYFTDKVDGNLKIDLDHIRSSFLIEEARQRAFDNKETNSLQNDDKLFVLDCTTLAPSTKGSFNGVLLMRENDGNLQILNNDSQGNGISFNWTLLGFKVGDTINITDGENYGPWTVTTIEASVLTLTGGGTIFSGDSYVNIEWFYTDVAYTNVTNQGFTLIEGIENPQDYSNLNYHWQRNIKRWYPYLATASKYIYNADPTSKIKTASFKNNGNLVTKKTGETSNVIDNYDIPTIDISSYKILNPTVHNIKVYADFNKLTNLIADIRDLKGYIKVKLNNGQNIKGYVKELDYIWISEELTIDIEEKFESDYLEITDTYIKEVGFDKIIYTESENNYLESFKISNIYVNLFNPFSERLTHKPTRFNKILLNGVIYTDKIAFSDALQTLIDSL